MTALTDVIGEQARGPWGKEPHELGRGPMLARFLVLQCGMPIALVPPEYWSLDGDVATVPCPCGELVTLEKERLIFDGTLDCERAYIYDGEAVWCINSPKGRPQAQPAEPGVDVPEEPDGA